MLVIRLIRIGKKNAPNFRVVLIDKKAAPRSGKFLEVLGSYNPRLPAKSGSASGGKKITLKKERIKYWLSQGVKTSETVHNLLVKEGVIEGPKIKKKISARKKKAKPAEEKGKVGKEEASQPVEEAEKKPSEKQKPKEEKPVEEKKEEQLSEKEVKKEIKPRVKEEEKPNKGVDKLTKEE